MVTRSNRKAIRQEEPENAGQDPAGGGRTVRAPIVLFSPEHFYLFSTLAVPQLTGYLEQRGYPVVPRVLDHEFYRNLSSAPCLEQILGRLDEALTGAPEEMIGHLTASLALAGLGRTDLPRELQGSVLAADLAADRRRIVENLNQAERALRSQFLQLDPFVFLLSMAQLQVTLDLFAAPYWPSTVNILYGLTTPEGTRSSAKIHDLVHDPARNPFLAYYAEHVLPTVPGDTVLAGISMTHASQLVPGLTLARLLKEQRPGVHVVLGGTILNTSRDALLQPANRLWELFDSLVLTQGEESLATLYEELVSGNPVLDRVPNLTYRVPGGGLHTASAEPRLSMGDIATPVFTDPRPNPILTLATSSSCDWGRCRFCHFKHILSDGVYRTRPVEDVVRDLEVLQERHAPVFVTLCDTNVAVGRLDSLSEALRGRGLPPLYAFARAEKQLTDPAFCTKLRQGGFFSFHIGIESGSQRLLDDMRKGIRLEDVSRILRNLHEAGFLTNVFIMVGTPTETEEEVGETLGFLKAHRAYLDGAISIGPYELERRQEIFENPEAYGIRYRHELDEDFTDKVSHVSLNGPDEERVEAMIAEMYRELGVEEHYMIPFLYRLLEMVQGGELDRHRAPDGMSAGGRESG